MLWCLIPALLLALFLLYVFLTAPARRGRSPYNSRAPGRRNCAARVPSVTAPETSSGR